MGTVSGAMGRLVTVMFVQAQHSRNVQKSNLDSEKEKEKECY